MRLAFFVQMIDPEDTIRGFIPGWIRALAKEVDELVVIVQENRSLGSVDLGANVRIFSLGKEQGKSKVSQFLALSQILSSAEQAGGVEALLTHMNPSYSIASSLFCAVKGIPLFTWYAHKEISFRLKLAHALSALCFSASEESFRLNSDKKRILGHGIDLSHFNNKTNHLSAGQGPLRFNSACRLSPVKRVELLLEAVALLEEPWHLDVAGSAGTGQQLQYAEALAEKSKKFPDHINWRGAVPYSKMPAFLRASDIHINVSATGSLDKGVLEAVASGQTVLTSNEAFKDFLKGTEERTFIDNPTAESLSQRLQELLQTPRELLQQDQEVLYQRLYEHHSLQGLAKKMVSEINNYLDLKKI